MDQFGYISSLGDENAAGADAAIHLAGMLSPSFVEGVYPYREMARWHNLQHIPGLTGRWMDTGGTAMRGAVRGSFHRIFHGHHLIEDGLTVLRHPELKFGEFLHHLGMDSLTRRGIPNPLLPRILVEKLVESGLPSSVVSEWVSVNIPKLLGGSLCLVMSGNDVVMALSDEIPHTWLAVGKHFSFGVLDTLFGIVTENPLVLVAAGGEFFASGLTAWRILMDPVADHASDLGGFFIPALGDAIGVGPLLAGAARLAAGDTVVHAADALLSSAAAATAVGYSKAAKVGLLMGLPVAGILAGMLTRRLLRSLNASEPSFEYQEALSMTGAAPRLMPMLALPPA